MAYAGSAVHIGCAFSLVEILAVLYGKYLRYPENNPMHEKRDYCVLSKGHGVMAQYACMYKLGWILDEAIQQYFSDGSELKGLSDSRVSGLEVTSGSLGHGLSIGVGLALGAKLRHTDQKTYVIVGDGELNEGAIWEGIMFSSHHKLSNFMMIVDENGFQAMGCTSEIIDQKSIDQKLKSFGFDTAMVDGHDEIALEMAISNLWDSDSGNPKALIAKTVKGKGVSFMENDNKWHYTRLRPDSYQDALRELSDARE